MADTPYSPEFRNWLSAATHSEMSAILVRCVLRALPGCASRSELNSDDDLQSLLRITLTTLVAAKLGRPLQHSLGLNVEEINYNTGQHSAEYGDFRRALKGMLTVTSSSPPYDQTKVLHTIHATGNVLDSFDSGVGAFALQARQIDSDVEAVRTMGRRAEELPLYRDIQPMERLGEGISKLLFEMKQPPFSPFWSEWYSGFLTGRPIKWKLQEAIASIPPKEWQHGAANIADKIEELNADFIAGELPIVETVSYSQEVAKFHSAPVPITKPDLLAATLSQVDDAVLDVLNDQSNGLNERSREVRVIRRTLSKYGNDPQRIEMDFTAVHAAISRQVISEELPPSGENIALKDALEEGALAIRATHDNIAENRRILSEQKLKELSAEQRAKLRQARPVLEDISEGVMAEDFAEDITHLASQVAESADVERYPYPTARDAKFGATEAAARLFSRVARIGVYLRRIPSTIRAIEKNSVYRATSILGTVANLIKMVMSLF